MTFAIELKPDRLSIRGDFQAPDEVEKAIRALRVLSPLLDGAEAAPEPERMVPRHVPETRAEKALKRAATERTARPLVTTPEPQEAAAPEPIEPPAATTHAAQPETPPVNARLARDERIRELWHTDMTLAMIGEEVNWSVPSVSLAAKRMGLPSRAHRANHRPADVPETAAPPPEPAPAPRKAAPEGNGHVFTMHGVSLTHEAITFNGKEFPITESQYRALHALLRAAPHPIGVPHLIGKVYPGRAKAEAETILGIVIKDLSRNLPALGLGIMDMKGVGIALTGSDA